MTEDWIAGAIKRPGAFTAKAAKRGMTVPEFRSQVLSNPDRYDEVTVKQANLAKTLAKISRKR
jgi:hypothetical protein